ncbi:MAG TPA: hypothetical protein VH143_25275 [Kofleriaceae bacterium]|nr:hypothetical protein [Kofleriaceae bacterium]
MRSIAASILITGLLAGCSSHMQSPIDDAAVGGPQGPQTGSIFVFSGGSEVPPISATATLVLPDDPFTCESDITVDACRIRVDCNAIDVTPVGGGQITFGTTPPVTIVSTAPAPGFAESDDVGDISAGQPVTFLIAGTGAVPAMSASVPAPSQATVTSSFDGTPIPTTSDFVLTWTGATTGTLELGVVAGIDGDFGLVDCSFPAAPGSGTISKAALQMFPSGGLARFELSNAVTQQAGAWTIELGVGYDALWPDGSYAQAVLNLTN